MIIQYDVVLPNSNETKHSADTMAACHMAAAARRGDHKIVIFDNGTAVLFNVFRDPSEKYPLSNASLDREMRAIVDTYGREGSMPADLPPSDSHVDGGVYNISSCGPEGEWPKSSGVWVPWR
jgi:hypothetical protein